MATDILMLHYNDVYNAEPLPPPAGTPAGSKAYIAAGATRFAAKVKSFKAEDPLVLFSGAREVADLGASHLVPLHRHLDEREAQSRDEVDELDVKGPPLNVEGGEEARGRGPGERA